MFPFAHPLRQSLVAAAAAAASLACAQTADKPTIAVGDHWAYKQVDKDGKEVSWGRKVLSVDADGGFTVQTAPDKTMKFDASWNFVDPRGAEYGRAAIRFPMKVGDEWSFISKQMLQTNLIDQRNKYKVVAQESLTVPAGTFDCFRVEGKADAAYKASYQQQIRETYWYCPKVNGVAKISRQTVVNSRDTPSWQEKLEQVLTRYTPKG